MGHARDAGLESEYALLGFFVFLHFVRQMRARSYEAHVAKQDVEELREFVDIEAAEEFSDFGYARIVLYLEKRTVGAFVFLHELGFEFVGIRTHGAELEHRERLAETSYPDAAVHWWMEVREPHGERGEYEYRRKRRDEESGDRNVETAFEHAAPRAETDAHDLYERHAGDERNFGSSGFVQKEAVRVPVSHAVRARDFENLFEIGFRKIGIQ